MTVDPRWQIEPTAIPGYWHVREIDDATHTSDIVKDDAGRVRLFGSAAAASAWIDAQTCECGASPASMAADCRTCG